MPIHDWTRVPPGLFHHFQQAWAAEIANRLNRGFLPPGLSALLERRAGPWQADARAVERHRDDTIYANRANRVAIKRGLAHTVAVIEIVSPGNKAGRLAIGDFVRKSVEFLGDGVNLLVIDLWPPTEYDPSGINGVIIEEFSGKEFTLPDGKDRTLAAYHAGAELRSFVEPVAIGDRMPEMPLFLAENAYVPIGLESTYTAAWDDCPEALRIAVETGVLPEMEE